MPAPKFNFIPERQLNEEFHVYTPAKISIHVTKNAKQCIHTLTFLSETVKLYDLNNKWIVLFADKEKRAIGWRILSNEVSLIALSDSKQLKKNKAGQITIGIGKLLKSMNIDLKKSIGKLEVKKYKPVLDEHLIFYIEIPKVEEKTNTLIN